MKFILASLAAIAALLLSLLQPAHAAPLTFNFDAAHTTVTWHINHFGFSNPSGKWLANGTLVLDEAHPQDSKVKVTIQMAELTTGIPKLDEHLKSVDFFDVKQFPTATFVSNKVDITGKDTANVEGDLTIHGVTKPVTLHVKLNKIAISPMTQKKTAGFTVSTTLKRSDFDITKYLPNIGDEVTINIEAEANR